MPVKQQLSHTGWADSLPLEKIVTYSPKRIGACRTRGFQRHRRKSKHTSFSPIASDVHSPSDHVNATVEHLLFSVARVHGEFNPQCSRHSF
ncbi:MAG: hypothetical protein JHC61_08425 [Burkholderiaceae bacterium]|nr:hypothetical protein [Burkholderiaceae bacterium]